MATEFKLPDLGENITGGDIVQVLVSEGDDIAPQQAVIEIETDKAVLEVPCPTGGKVTKIHVKAGDKAKVGQTLMTIEANGQAAGGGKAPAAPAEVPDQAKPKQAQREESKRGGSQEAAVAASADEAPARKAKPAARKAPVREAAPAKPAPEPEPESEEDSEAVDPGAHLRGAPASPPRPAAKVTAKAEPVAAGPATRRLARELGVDLEAVAAARPGERLSEEDIKHYVRGELSREPGEDRPLVQEPPLPDFSQWGEVERVSMSGLNRKSAEHISVGWLSAPHVTQFDEADISALETLRKRYRDRGQTGEVKLTVTAFVLKAVVTALKSQPYVNSSIDMRSGEIILKKYYHVGVAVDTEAGLIVPVIRDVDQKRVLEIAAELEETAERTRRRKIKPEELRGGTFTVTNLGGIGGTAFTPIINHPEVAILGLARSREVPVVRDGQLATRLVLPLCLSYDHRVINGADGARFLRKVASLLEDPEMLLLEG